MSLWICLACGLGSNQQSMCCGSLMQRVEDIAPSVDIVPLLNAAACVVAAEQTIREHIGGSAASSVALLKAEMGLVSEAMKLTDSDTIARLTHVHREGGKCIIDFWRFRCPRCDQAIQLEHLEFDGQRPVTHRCGFEARFNFAAVVKRWTGEKPAEALE